MKNDKGFSLIEIMIAIGLLAGLSAWMMHLFQVQTKIEKTTATSMDIDAIGNEIRNVLAVTDSLVKKHLKVLRPQTCGGHLYFKNSF